MAVGSVSQIVGTILIRGDTNRESIGGKIVKDSMESLVGHK